jgi:hypothetical protein
MADQTQHPDASGTADLSVAGEFRIFLSYRREDASGHAGRLFDFLHYGGGLGPGFSKDQIFMDIDTVAPGVDFRHVIEQAVCACDVFIAVIGTQWLNAADARGRRRLDNAQDFVRIEIEAALARDIPVVPTLVQGAQMPTVEELPETFGAFVHRNAVELSDARWSYDVSKLVAWLKTVEEEKTRREQAEREQAERAERERADQERLERDRAERVGQLEQERRRYHHKSTPPEGGHLREGNDEQREPERRRFSRKHVLVVAALLALAIAGIASALVLVSESKEREATGNLTATQPKASDADGDRLPDAKDPFALDPGDGKKLRVRLTFDDPVSGTVFKKSGFTGLMTDRTTPYGKLYDPGNVIVRDGTFKVSAVGPGDALEAQNDQRNAFQVGIRVPKTTFTAHVRLIEPFADAKPRVAQSMGLFVGTGDQDNYVRLAIGGAGVSLLGEVRGVKKYLNSDDIDLSGLEAVDLYLTIYPAAKIGPKIGAQVWETRDGERSHVPTPELTAHRFPPRWVDGHEALAVGIISTSGGADPFAAIWRIVEVVKGGPPPTTTAH